ncbi:OsmC family protein [Rhizobium sp. BK376]|uniref:OsmC family protein n=1 Tax=Rhizobium sp. BK376 TaxID=2512149 RepID=UPI00104A5E96|nr:OsmC family protein [Rhizobium sp. BK376]TCR76804.1 osmotically inducible protein OsmC [Rhizobium sp. BK376]
MKIVRKGSAEWAGGMKDGKGAISTESGALSAYPYGFASRFGDLKGSNPEELVGAAHASCFSMAFSMVLGQAELIATSIKTNSAVAIESVGDGFAITSAHLTVEAKIPGATDKLFQKLATAAKENCPVSKLLNANITMDAVLVN